MVFQKINKLSVAYYSIRTLTKVSSNLKFYCKSSKIIPDSTELSNGPYFVYPVYNT